MDLNRDILKLTCQLYKNVSLTRTEIQSIITLIREFISTSYNPFLLKMLQQNLYKAISDEIAREISETFNKYSDPFENYSTEDKRLVLYKKLDLYIEPKTHLVKTETFNTTNRNELCIHEKEITLTYLPMKNSLKNLLELEGLFDELIRYMDFLKKEKTVLTNFIQGELWEQQIKNFDKNGIGLPLLGYFDDIECGNALGSHAGNNNVGAVYVTIPCLPPSYASKLESIIMFCVFHSKDRKKYGNKAIFDKFIEELREIRENGIEIIANKKKYKIYFLTNLILGDNLGVNSIMGFVESFSSTVFCRMCYATPDIAKTLTEQDDSLMRTVENYEKDIENINVRKTGIKEQCIFNNLSNFHVIENSSVDVMHDMFEGVCNYVMTRILLTLILDDNCFSIDYLNYKLHTEYFDYELSNIPPQINMDYVKKNNKLKMSATEILFFTRYFGVLIGDQVPKENKVWELYKKLREIVHIVTSPILRKSYLLQLEMLVSQHHKLYINLFGNLKAKFHNLIHYAKLMLKIGPVIKVSSMRFESKHRILKSAILQSSCHKNILKSIGIRYQLSQMNVRFSSYKDLDITHGVQIEDILINYYFPFSTVKYALRSVTVNDVTYKCKTIIAAYILEDGLEYGEISKIYSVDSNIFFEYIPFQLIGFNSHYFAHSVVPLNEKKIIRYDSLISRIPCLLFKRDGTMLIATRHVL